MPKFLLSFAFVACLSCLVGCSGGEKGDGHMSDPTPPGEANEIQDMSPEAIGDMEKVGNE